MPLIVNDNPTIWREAATITVAAPRIYTHSWGQHFDHVHFSGDWPSGWRKISGEGVSVTVTEDSQAGG